MNAAPGRVKSPCFEKLIRKLEGAEIETLPTDRRGSPPMKKTIELRMGLNRIDPSKSARSVGMIFIFRRKQFWVMKDSRIDFFSVFSVSPW
jgi:hypothetical protein